MNNLKLLGLLFALIIVLVVIYSEIRRAKKGRIKEMQ